MQFAKLNYIQRILFPNSDVFIQSSGLAINHLISKIIIIFDFVQEGLYSIT